MANRNRIQSVSYPEIEEEMFGAARAEIIAKINEHKDAVTFVAVENHLAEQGVKKEDDEFAYMDKMSEVFNERKNVLIKLHKELDNAKPAGADQLIAQNFVNRSVASQFGEHTEEVRAALRSLQGARVHYNEGTDELNFQMPARRSSGNGSSGPRGENRKQVASVQRWNAAGQPVYNETGGIQAVAKFMQDHAEQTGFNAQLGSGKDASGRPYIYHKGRTVDERPKPGTGAAYLCSTEPNAEGKYQGYTVRYGRNDASYQDYVMACVLLNPGEQIRYTDKQGDLIAYHRKDEHGVTYCSPTGKEDDETSRKFTHAGVVYNNTD